MIGRSAESIDQHFGQLADALQTAADRLSQLSVSVRDFASFYKEDVDADAVHEGMLPFVDRTVDSVSADLQSAARRVDFMTRPQRGDW